MTETEGVRKAADLEPAIPASWPWRPALAVLALVVAVAMIAGSFVLQPALQARVVQFMIPPYSYVCLGLAAIALVETKEARGRRVFMALALLAMTALNVLTYAVEGVQPLFILGVHMGFLIGWMALPRRAGWTLFWLVEALVWIGIAAVQGRLPLP